MIKTIKVDGKEVKLKASAAIPRLYRIRFHRDILRDLKELDKAIKSGDELPIQMLQIFEDVAFMMARHADPDNVPDSPEEWLDGFDGTFSIFEILPEIIDLWSANMETLSTPKKK